MKNQVFASLSLAAKCFTQHSDCQVACHMPIGQACNDAAIIQVNDRTIYSAVKLRYVRPSSI